MLWSASVIPLDLGVTRIAYARTWKSTDDQMAHWLLPAPPPWQSDDWHEASPVNFASSTGAATAQAVTQKTKPATARCQEKRTQPAYRKSPNPAI
jgi:hypothetical protein